MNKPIGQRIIDSLEDFREYMETGGEIKGTTLISFPHNFVLARVKMTDGTLSEPKWFVRTENGLHDFNRALTGPPLPDVGVEIYNEGHVFVRDQHKRQ